MSGMEQRPLGNSGISVSAVSIGTWAIGGANWGAVNDEESVAAIQEAIDVGMTFIDTADIYGKGHSEEIVGKAIKGRRDQVVVATKVANRWNEAGEVWPDCSYDYILEAVRASMERLQTDYIDAYIIHRPDPNTPIPETMRALDKLLNDGVVRAVGVSRYDREQIEQAQQCIQLHIAQYPLNIYRREEITPILPFCRQHEIGVMAYAPLSKGLLTGKFDSATTFPENDLRSGMGAFQGAAFKDRLDAVEKLRPIAARHGKTLAQLAINWNLCQPGVTTALTGAKTPQQVRENAGGAGWRLTTQDLNEIERIAQDLTDAS
jgi:aryl-alcohol dehydrogenase-like predicted oxidoreductase